MNLKTWYDSGSATVLSGSTTVTGTGALWGTGSPDDNIMVGDLFSVPSQPMVPAIPIATVSADGALELLWAWPGADVTAQPYIIRYVGIIERSTRANRMALERMGEISAWYDVIVETNADRLALETAGSPLRAEFRVLVRDAGVIWAKKTGAYSDWIGPVEFKGDKGDTGPVGVNWRGTYSAATLYAINDGVTFSGSSFRKLTAAAAGNAPSSANPPVNNANWAVVAAKGATGGISGVTTFWQDRITVDTTALAARAGLGLVKQTGLLDRTEGALQMVGAFGNGGILDLRGTVFETGTPTDLGSTGQVVGLATSAAIGLPAGVGTYCVLSSSMPWSGATALSAYHRKAMVQGRVFIQTATSLTAWGAWKEVLAGTGSEVRSALGLTTFPETRNLLINATGQVNARDYVSGTATTAANQYTLDRWKVVSSGQSLSWSDSAGVRTFTAPAGGVEQPVWGANLLSGVYSLSWVGTATATVNGSAVTKGGQVTLTAGTNAVVRFIGGTFALPQLEFSPFATGFSLRSFQDEVSLCQTYCMARPMASRATTTGVASGFMFSTTSARMFFPTPVDMRATPTLEFESFSIVNPHGQYNVTSISSLIQVLGGVGIIMSTATSAGTGPATLLSSGKLILDAEIY